MNYCIHFEPNLDQALPIRKNAMPGLKKFAERIPEWCPNTSANRSRLKREKQEEKIRRLTNSELKTLLKERGDRLTGNKPELQRRVIDGLPVFDDAEEEEGSSHHQAWLLNGLVVRRHSQIGRGNRYSASELDLMWLGKAQITTSVHVVQPATKAGGSACKDKVVSRSTPARKGRIYCLLLMA